MGRWVWRGLAAAPGIVVVAVLGLFAASEAMIRGKAEAPLVEVAAATDPGAIARGRQLATLYGCNGCHQANLQGNEWSNTFWDGRVYASNLTQVMPHYSDAQLARAIRAGVRPDGSRLWAMPSESWVTTTDAEMADLLAYLRSHARAGKATPKATFGPLTRWRILTGEIEPTTAWVTRARANPAFDAGGPFERGRHLATTVCSECHGSNLKGYEGDTPDLMIAASYDLPGFTRLMRTGVAADGKERRLMSEVSRSRFSHFTEQDVKDLHAYLTARAEQAP
ncbi:cytochrome c4 [Brevundimonas lenta]|uniref:Mono/diheme cytochrome c family protein n=1 Tax=Brevundimonas lenta TaxID=424796 RepID=A0A7W6JHV5_9CAUL|nr:c-type cytochrome [Brevundimonas lenta]MBB4084433.1 mono/diheme cytochrome c family protein [Brevundimonas lenta]